MLRNLRPLPQSMRGVSCAKCDRTQASWRLEMPAREPEFVCALCVLYDPVFVGTWDEPIEKLITNVETGVGHMFERGPDGRLLRSDQADRVLGVAVLTTRVLGVTQKARRMHGEPK